MASLAATPSLASFYPPKPISESPKVHNTSDPIDMDKDKESSSGNQYTRESVDEGGDDDIAGVIPVMNPVMECAGGQKNAVDKDTSMDLEQDVSGIDAKRMTSLKKKD